MVKSVAGAVVLVLAAVGLVSPSVLAAHQDPAHPKYLGKTFYTGEFHAHTSVSDGVEMPQDAFDYVRGQTDADFVTLSEHDVMWDLRTGEDFLDDWRDADSTEWRTVHQQAIAFNKSQQDLVAVPAIENTWYDGTGHINVFNTDWHATARATEKGSIDGFANSFGTGDLKYDMPTFFARLKLDPDAIAQFNHPSTTSKGNFFGFKGLDPTVDDRIDLIEVKTDGQFAQFQQALDVGWHLGPVWNGDEHTANWVKSNPAITGVWAKSHSLSGLYAAMRDRSVFSTLDVNSILGFSADDHLMGSILPATKTSTSFDVWLTDPDASDSFTSVRLYTNHGQVAHAFPGVSGNNVHLTLDQPVADGDYYYVRADQADGDFVVSAPIWFGKKTRDANYAPVITVQDRVPDHAGYGQTIKLPAVSATDDSGVTPTVSYEVYDSAGRVPVTGGAFRIRSYQDHFVVVKATDATGSTNAELLRITVDQKKLDPAGVFAYFGSTAAVSERPGGAGVAVTTDRSIGKVYAQVLPAGSQDWSKAQVRTSTNDRAYEVNTIGNDEPEYQHSITGQALRSHEFDVADLRGGERYQYRFGVAVKGRAPSPSDASAWTAVKGQFVAGGTGNEPVYVVGDLQATTHDAADLGLLRGVVDRLKTEQPGGGTVLQLGDLVDNGGRGQYWDEVADHVFDGLDLQYAPVAGNHETYGDLDYNAYSPERTAIFSNMFDTPKNGVIGESNYSFDRGDIHFSVLNSNVDMDKQLAWLRSDVRASTRRWNVVTGHFSYYGGEHGNDAGLAADRPKVTKALHDLGVDLYIGAHDHVYKRSTIFDGRLARNPDEEARGTTFVTMGSAGPKFYDNTVHWWDDVVFDENTQVGGVLRADGDGLTMSTYTIDGRVVDAYTVHKPTGDFELATTDIENRELRGVGFRSYTGSRDTLTVAAATYDNSQQRMIELRTADVKLDHRGAEQFVTFDKPLPVAPGDTVKVFVWDSLAGGRSLIPAVTVREGIAGNGTAADPYLIRTAADLPKIANDPAGVYQLTADLDLTGTTMSQIGRLVSFTGVFDGAGHTIRGYTAPADEGSGLFADNHGTIRNLSVDATVNAAKITAGIVADVNHGTIERVRTSGSITATERVGGIVGDHYGTLRDSYSTAAVHATNVYSGGLVGIALGGSTTENAYASGAVIADARNAGGVVSYGYDETVVQHVVAINAAVTAPSFAHGIVGRVLDGNVATLTDNHTSAVVPVSVQSLAAPPAADNWKGALVPVAQVRTKAFYEQRGWDFGTVWDWSETGLRPVLRAAREDVAPIATPSLPRDASGAYIVDSAADLAQVGEFPEYDFVLAADLSLKGTSFTSLGGARAFTGSFDGAGHTISGLTSTTGGLFNNLSGSVHDLGIVDATVTKSTANNGIVANTNSGTIERVYVTGTISGAGYVGGIAGTSAGTIRDAYSRADVTVTSGRYSGGIVGVPAAGSVTERTYATGAIATNANESAGGITGYSYTGTVVRNNFALNPSVTASNYGQRVVARTYAGHTPTLENNYAVETLTAGKQADTTVGAATLNGLSRTVSEARTQDTWETGLGWDFTGVWQWSGDRPVLRSVPEQTVTPPTAPALDRDTDGHYLVRTSADLAEVAAWPAEKFRLAADIAVSGSVGGIGGATGFTGELDGAGHVLTGFTSTTGGLFSTIGTTGNVHDLGVVDASVTKSANIAGILVDTHRGTIERVFTSGSVTTPSYAGGIAGTSFGTIRDAYSTASATTTTSNYAGGIIGVADSPSVTERVYATGAVKAGGTTAGGLTGYARDSRTVVRDSFALNPTVTAGSLAQRVVARFANGQTGTLANNFAVETLVAGVQSNPATGPATLNGETRTSAEAGTRATWESGLGWDFGTVWTWDDTAHRPVLRNVSSPVAAPAGLVLEAAPELGITSVGHEAVLGADGVATVTAHLGSKAGGARLSVLLLDGERIAYLNEAALDSTGDATVRIAVPTLAKLTIALGTSAGTPRYVAPLDPARSVKITVDGHPVAFTDAHQTAGSILAAAGVDPASSNLAEPKGPLKQQVYPDNQLIDLEEGDAYVTVRTAR
ncbi:3',5'-cyclic AMP phosphodiesterase CpdA [Asanoa hainanensis]|uniref:3',5'-cyclic AMP phosphodiesterase CpdA n=1 Tax=Asanoa hainanensis TaxID=560556 RepID=A0A239JYE5_9ACTN|nr:metallophosphoesterase [Asanoa hainanensis]SNT10805.1 3',5'-cyclic AMP phosphodiesterase CpdA [Asanoa hainanensis]